uniref:Serine aminopeptidase S33 domain-containing protein n=1 Tax=Aegilops tauschii TaxID=37682 RepID=M8B362_AEGTA
MRCRAAEGTTSSNPSPHRATRTPPLGHTHNPRRNRLTKAKHHQTTGSHTVPQPRFRQSPLKLHFEACGFKLAAAGYGVFGIDYEGHGKSMGARCYIQKFDRLVADCDRFFKSICDLEEYRSKSRFLYGESMGGAVALLLHRKDPAFWDGAVLVAPMCKISEKVKPHPVVVTLLTQDPVKRENIRRNKLIYQDKPRLKTALELLRTSMDVEDSLSEVTMPFFILHGEADTVTDPEVSRALYDRAASTDKTIKLYPGMWHGLTAGEPDDNVELVFADIVAWLNKRSHHRKPEHGGRVTSAPSEPARYQRRPVSGGSGMDSPVSMPRRRGRFLCGQCRM